MGTYRAKLRTKIRQDDSWIEWENVSGDAYEVAVGVAERRDDTGRHFAFGCGRHEHSEFLRIMFGLIVTH